MTPRTGLTLRLLGPLIEIACAAALMRTWGQGRTVLGVAIEPLLMAGFGLGLALVIAGLTLVKRRHPSRRAPRD